MARQRRFRPVVVVSWSRRCVCTAHMGLTRAPKPHSSMGAGSAFSRYHRGSRHPRAPRSGPVPGRDLRQTRCARRPPALRWGGRGGHRPGAYPPRRLCSDSRATRRCAEARGPVRRGVRLLRADRPTRRVPSGAVSPHHLPSFEWCSRTRRSPAQCPRWGVRTAVAPLAAPSASLPALARQPGRRRPSEDCAGDERVRWSSSAPFHVWSKSIDAWRQNKVEFRRNLASMADGIKRKTVVRFGWPYIEESAEFCAQTGEYPRPKPSVVLATRV